jgi:hypothetical protein
MEPPAPAVPRVEALTRVLVLRTGVLRALVERLVVLRRVVVAARVGTGVTSTVALAAAEPAAAVTVEAEGWAGDGVRALPEAGAPEGAVLACSAAEDGGLVEAEERRRGAGVAIAREEGMERRTRCWSAIHPASSDR